VTQLPTGWRRARFGEAAETALGKMLDKGRSRGLPKVPYLRNVNVQWGSVDLRSVLQMELADEERERFGLRVGDLLVCEGGEIGRAAIWGGSTGFMAYQKALHRVRPHPGTDPRFLRYQLERLANDGTLARFSTGSTIRHLPQQALRAVPIALPSIETQRRVVAILEEHLSDLDAAGACLKSAGSRAARLRAAELERLFGSSGRVSVSLSEVIAGIAAGKSFGAADRPALPSEWGIIKVSAMTWGEFRPNENKSVRADRVDPRFEIRPGDLLVSRANTSDYVGASVLVPAGVRPRLLLSDKSLRATPAPDVNPEWLWRALQAPSARHQISALATGTKESMRNISQDALKSVLVPVAARSDQERRVAAFLDVESTLGRQGPLIRDLTSRAQSLRRAIFAAAFSGRLTGHGSDTEVISELAEEESA